MKNKYTDIKEIFTHEDGYINLEKSALAYKKILNCIDKPIKLVLFYGKAGSGKTFLLQKIYSERKENGDIIYFAEPFFSETQFLEALYEKSYGENKNFKNYEQFLKACKSNATKKTAIVLLDEAGFYPENLLEKIRLIADTKIFKFLFAVHKSDKDNIFNKDHFKTRISETIEIGPLDVSGVQVYIHKKIGDQNFFDRCPKFTSKQLVLITEFTQGNLRMINNLMYNFFELYEFYEQNNPSIIGGENVNTKILEMSAIKCGVIDA